MEQENKEQEPNKKKDFFYFFGIPSIINALVALLGIELFGLPGLITASMCIVVGFFLIFAKYPHRGAYMILAGVLAWLIGASICGLMLSGINFGH